MKSTGEVMGKDLTLEKALYKGLVASGINIPTHGSVIITVADKDKEEAMEIAKRFHEIGYNLLATAGTAQSLTEQNIPVQVVNKIDSEGLQLTRYYPPRKSTVCNQYINKRQTTSA